MLNGQLLAEKQVHIRDSGRDYGPEAKMYLREAIGLAKIAHRHIIQLVGAYTADPLLA